MLVLTRHPGEKVMISDNVEMMILSVKGQTVRIGIETPKHVEIYRQEIYVKVQKEQQEVEGNRGNQEP